jgi:hypothetical protein
VIRHGRAGVCPRAFPMRRRRGRVIVRTLGYAIEHHTVFWVKVELHYDVADPFAVHMWISNDHDCADWLFSRDIIKYGLHSLNEAPAGVGDVQAWVGIHDRDPYNETYPDDNDDSFEDAEDNDVWRFTLYVAGEDNDTLTMHLPIAHVRRFLRLTYKIVPEGRENVLAYVDNEINSILDDNEEFW